MSDEASVITERIDGSAAMSADRRYRWSLKRWWEDGEGQICWVMLNPSVADETRDDPTLRRVLHFSRTWKYQAVEVVNLFPLVSPDPRVVRRWAADEFGSREDRHANASVVRRAMDQANRVIVAWGAVRWAYDWSEYVIEDSWNRPRPALYALGETTLGFPSHPLARGRHRIPDDREPMLWREARA